MGATVLAYLGRFAWLPLAAAGGTWSPAWRELRQMAATDGAGPLRRLFSIVLPQSWPALITIALLQFFYTWNETRLASLYLGVNSHFMPVSFGVQTYQSLVPIQNVIEAGSVVRFWERFGSTNRIAAIAAAADSTSVMPRLRFPVVLCS